MRHHNKIKKFGRKRKTRIALMRTLASSFFRARRIKTTEAKAKALRPIVEKLITRARHDSPVTRRLLHERVGNASLAQILCKKIAPKYASRLGGYTRVVKAGIRRSDGARMAIIELV